jgi:hypothetical protein
LYRVVRTSDSWRRAEKFGPQVNVNGTEIGPMIAPDGRSFVFSRNAGANVSGELFIATPDARPAGKLLTATCSERR